PEPIAGCELAPRVRHKGGCQCNPRADTAFGEWERILRRLIPFRSSPGRCGKGDCRRQEISPADRAAPQSQKVQPGTMKVRCSEGWFRLRAASRQFPPVVPGKGQGRRRVCFPRKNATRPRLRNGMSLGPEHSSFAPGELRDFLGWSRESATAGDEILHA